MPIKKLSGKAVMMTFLILLSYSFKYTSELIHQQILITIQLTITCSVIIDLHVSSCIFAFMVDLVPKLRCTNDLYLQHQGVASVAIGDYYNDYISGIYVRFITNKCLCSYCYTP